MRVGDDEWPPGGELSCDQDGGELSYSPRRASFSGRRHCNQKESYSDNYNILCHRIKNRSIFRPKFNEFTTHTSRSILLKNDMSRVLIVYQK